MKEILKTLEQNDLKFDQESLDRVNKTIKMYEESSKVRYKKRIDNLKKVAKHIKEKL